MKLAKEREADAAYQARREAVRAACEASIEGEQLKRCIIFPLPHFARPVTHVSPDRRDNFFQHLRDIIFQYRQVPDAEHVEHTTDGSDVESDPLITAACAACGGHCCERGGDHAFLSVETLARFCQQHPGLSDEQLESAYLARLPLEALQDSCIFHTSSGCALPRPQRSAMCNRFLCDDVQRMLGAQQAHSSHEQPPADYYLLASIIRPK